MVDQIFTKFDIDRNGSIDREEAKPIFIEVLKKSEATKIVVDENVLNEYFSKADLNQDGKITREEAAIFIGSYLIK